MSSMASTPSAAAASAPMTPFLMTCDSRKHGNLLLPGEESFPGGHHPANADLIKRVRGGGALRVTRGRPPFNPALDRPAHNGHDRDGPNRVGRPPGRKAATDDVRPVEHAQFEMHSWGESAVGAIGETMAEDAVWETHFQQLVDFYNTTRAELPVDWMKSASHRRMGVAPPAKGTPLRAWVDKQRQLYRHGELDIKRQQRLQETGLQLTLKGKLREVDWEMMVGRLKSFYMLHGHCRVHEHEGEELLEQWVQVQQMKEMRGTLSHEKQALLNSLGMSWKSSWLDAWKQLCLLKQQHGRIQVQQLKKSKRLIPLYIWLRNQRMMQLDGSLDVERVEMLDRLGCRWVSHDSGDSSAWLGSSMLDRYVVWEPRFNDLVFFKQMHGHCDLQVSCVSLAAGGGGCRMRAPLGSEMARAASGKGRICRCPWAAELER